MKQLTQLFKCLLVLLLAIPLVYFIGYAVAIVIRGEALALASLNNPSASLIIFSYFVITVLIVLAVVLLTRRNKKKRVEQEKNQTD